jgi:single-strand DNA-binding protein
MNTPASIEGNLTADPIVRFTQTGKPVANMGVAVNRNRQLPDGTWESEAEYFDVVAWEQLAMNCAETLTKGMRIVVAGNLRMRTWADKTTGEKRNKIELSANSIGVSLRFATAKVTKNERQTPVEESIAAARKTLADQPADEVAAKRTTKRTAKPKPAPKAPVAAGDEPF